jgi:hypothetical protein
MKVYEPMSKMTTFNECDDQQSGEPSLENIPRNELINLGNRLKHASETFARINDYLRTIQNDHHQGDHQ